MSRPPPRAAAHPETGAPAIRSRPDSRRRDRHSWPLGDPGLRWYAYARVAWRDLLFAQGAGPGDNVLLPDLICDVMLEPLHRLGIEPRYYRADPMCSPAATDLIPHVDAQTRAVLAVHYFGFPTGLAEAVEYCRSAGILLVEDVSQGFLSADRGLPLGSIGDAALFSFRKTLSLPHGAGLLVRDPTLAKAMVGSGPRLPAGRRDVWRYWGKRLDRRCLGGHLERTLDRLRDHTSRPSDPPRSPAPGPRPPTPDSRPPTPDPFDACLVRPSRTARWIIAGADLTAESKRRRTAFARLAERWKRERWPGRPLVDRLQAGWVPYAFPLRPDGGDVERLTGELVSAGLAAEPWPRLPPDSSEAVQRRRWVLVHLSDSHTPA